MASQTYSRAEVAKHNTGDSLWFIIDSKVYDATEFVDAHPGGEAVLTQVAGTDATEAFYNLHRHEVFKKYGDLCIGTIEGEKPQVIEPQAGDLSQVPYGEPLWLSPQYTTPPYYKDSHRRLQKAMREFTDKYLYPEAQECEETGRPVSQECIDRMAKAGILHMRLGPGPHLHGVEILGGIMKGEDYDNFHDLVVGQELTRVNARGFESGNLGGMTIGLPCVMHHAKPESFRKQIMDECLSGRKKICLAITEAFAGSDVARLRTTAVKTPDGKHYVVNGTKKWITNGTFCDYFVTAANTGRGLSLLLIHRGEGVETRKITTSGSATSGTSYVTFDDVHVPVGNLLGEENKGFQAIVANFNHERWIITSYAIAAARTVTEESLKWAHQRLVFGKRLIDQPVIRLKLARMISHVEAHQSWLETITYQMCNMTPQQQAKLLAGPIALLKLSTTRASHDISDDAAQIWGGRGLTKTGMGRIIEMYSRVYKFDSILGGAEEVMADLGVRQAMKGMPKAML